MSECLKKGNFIDPTVMIVSDLKNIVMKEETFGPLFVLYKVTSGEEAIDIANDSLYGLGGVVISQDTLRAEKFAR